MANPSLRRSIGLPLLTLYGLGTILGAGIYVLIGEIVAVSGATAPSAFLLAAVLAGITAFSFAELGSRIPKSAGEAAYVLAAFDRRWFSAVTGWAVVAVGIVSAATMTRGLVGYANVFVSLNPAVIVTVSVVALAAIAVWGIGESLFAAAAITVIEIGGLVFVCVVAGDSFIPFAQNWQSVLPSFTTVSLVGIASGAFIAFYAFIGFEDIVNIAEEVKRPERNLPLAIVISLFVSTALYVLIAIVAVFAMPIDQLAGNEAPLALIVESRGLPRWTIAAISLLAVVNGALVQMIMASRVIYGLSTDGLCWPWLGSVNRLTRTPAIATVLVALAVLGLGLLLSLGQLARVTSFVSLSIFTAVNLSLWRLKLTTIDKPSFSVPTTVPAIGAILCIAMIAYEGVRSLS